MSDDASALLSALSSCRSAMRQVESVGNALFPDAAVLDLQREIRWTSRKLARVAERYGATSQAIEKIELMG